MKRKTAVRLAPYLLVGLGGIAGSGAVQAQLVSYNAALGAYKDLRSAGVELRDTVTPRISAETSVARALRKGKVIEQDALVQSDGSLELPTNQTNLVIRSTLEDVQQSPSQIRIASPTIEGNVYGNVTLFVDGKGLQNVTVLNSGR